VHAGLVPDPARWQIVEPLRRASTVAIFSQTELIAEGVDNPRGRS
jgi:hypothetical protein